MELNFKKNRSILHKLGVLKHRKKGKSCLSHQMFAEEAQLGMKDNDKKHLNSVKYLSELSGVYGR